MARGRVLEHLEDEGGLDGLRWRRVGRHRVRLGRDPHDGTDRIVSVEHPGRERAGCPFVGGLHLWEEFTDRPVDRIVEVDAPSGAPDVVWVVGRLAALHVRDGRHRREHELRPQPWLCGDHEHRLWVCARKGHGPVRLPWLEASGVELLAVEYVSDKWTGAPVRYLHDFDSPCPELVLGSRREPLIAGGAYRLTSLGIEG